MIIRNITGMLIACMALAVGCSKESAADPGPDGNGQSVIGETAKVDFRFGANFNQEVDTRSSAIVGNKLGILAFRRDESSGDYVYYQSINTANFTANDQVITGSDYLPLGMYKFLATYGLTTNNGIGITPWSWSSSTGLNGTEYITHVTSQALPEIFLETARDDVSQLTSYILDGMPGQTAITKTLNRAVARVDFMFVRAVDNGEGANPRYTEIPSAPGDKNVLGLPTTIDRIEFGFTNVNPTMNYLGKIIADYTPVNHTYNSGISTEKIINGSSASTIIDDNFFRWDNILTEDLGYTAAYVKGPYLMPADPARGETTVTFYVSKREGGGERTIQNVSIPLQANSVSLVKVYVLGETLFNTEIEIALTVDTSEISEPYPGEGGLWE